MWKACIHYRSSFHFKWLPHSSNSLCCCCFLSSLFSLHTAASEMSFFVCLSLICLSMFPCAFVKWHLSVLTAFTMPGLCGIAIIVRAVICREINTHPVNELQIKYTCHMLTPWKDMQHMVGGWRGVAILLTKGDVSSAMYVLLIRLWFVQTWPVVGSL